MDYRNILAARIANPAAFADFLELIQTKDL
jgi:hypothetical protein